MLVSDWEGGRLLFFSLMCLKLFPKVLFFLFRFCCLHTLELTGTYHHHHHIHALSQTTNLSTTFDPESTGLPRHGPMVLSG